MKLFKRKGLRQARALRQAQDDTLTDRAAKGITKVILKMQKSFAAFMGKQAGRISASSLKFLLVIFFVTGTGLSVYCVVEAFTEKKIAIKVGRIQVPKYYEGNDETVQPGVSISKQQYGEMLGFQSYMDSLKQTNLGTYDSIVACRPGLLDSVKVLERIYEQQK